MWQEYWLRVWVYCAYWVILSLMTAQVIVLGAFLAELIRYRWSERAKLLGLSFCALFSLYLDLCWLSGFLEKIAKVVLLIFLAIIFYRLAKKSITV